MATKKKRRESGKPKRASAKKSASRKAATQKPAPKSLKKRAATSSKKKRTKSTTRARKTVQRKSVRKNVPREVAGLNRNALESRSGTMSGDLQGLREKGTADSESVSELLEEGNAFEAGIVAGVEDAEDNPEQEVHSHEIPEDDVPQEYLDEE